jgi:DNA-binding transcriptional LysR family regulator
MQRCGVTVSRKLPGPHFNNYTITIQAACDGGGIALGWRRLLQQQIESGKLMQVLSASAVPEEAYHLLTPDGRRQDAAVRAFETWMAVEARRDWR